jgi:hypothetical protein
MSRKLVVTTLPAILLSASAATPHSAQPSAGIVFVSKPAIPRILPRVPTAPVATRGKEVLGKHANQIATNSSTQGRSRV